MPYELVPLGVANWAKIDRWPKLGQSHSVFLEKAFKIQEVSQVYLDYTMMLSEIRVGTTEIKASHKPLSCGRAKVKILEEGTSLQRGE